MTDIFDFDSHIDFHFGEIKSEMYWLVTYKYAKVFVCRIIWTLILP